MNVAPLQKAAATLSTSDVERLLTAHFEVVRHTRQVPLPLKQSFTNFTELPFDMNDPGDPMSTDNLIAAPSRQLIFAAVSKTSAIIVYEQGSFASMAEVFVFSYSDEGRGWAAAVNDHPPRDIPDLQKVLRESKFIVWERNRR